ncbi:hypothetical protein DFP93_13221 [Aneurinibacillus soli]|uniref:Uncharacterized protein n=2 Tax=Aneurinibacillus soli TaxID=1500254 RepID=A0A0U5AZR6_9BACL|nr:hypothetical protein [Aneurinibacillus soli]PYE57262.1 hypothetical protein DFP93_13221 [Aneurinibacillus soli]BAU29258.1 hypothetical protein CB4_03445 [Aneurinibacillus soli]
MLLHRLLNPLFFKLRSRIRWSRSGYRIVHPGVSISYTGEVRNRFNQLCTAYPTVQTWAREMDEALFRRNVLVLDWLDQFGRRVGEIHRPGSWLDIGSKNFDYAYAFRAIQAAGGDAHASLSGVELDGYRVYRDGYSRYDHAMYHAARTESTYMVDDVLEAKLLSARTVTLLFPFVFAEPLLLWGLSPGAYRPQDIYDRALALTESGGELRIANQGEREAAESYALLQRCCKCSDELEIIEVGKLICQVETYPADVYGFIVRKK